MEPSRRRKLTVGASLIVRDEEKFLGGCLESLAGRVDDIVVVDTGSQDGTIDIARAFDARVFYFPWQSDFSAARNYGLDQSRCDWVLYIDADERLASPPNRPVAEMIDPLCLAADIGLRPKTNYTRYRLTRLFRSDSRLRFEGAIHETIMPAIEAVAGGDPAAVGLSLIEIDHLGYEGDQSQKHARNLPLLERCITEYPRRVFYRFHLAETLLGLGRVDAAEEAGREGIALAEASSAPKERVDGAMICQMLAAERLSRGCDPTPLIDTGLRLHPENHGLHLTQARHDLLAGNAARALETACALQDVDPDALPLGLVAYDRDVFGKYAREIQIASLARLGRMSEAALLLAANAGALRR